ncbi:MAG: HAD hydrolase family protein [Pseudomonadota bacterium]
MDLIHAGIHLEIPGSESLIIKQLVLDFTGTLSCDGVLLPGVVERLNNLAEHVQITVLTADTFGTAAEQLRPLPVNLHLIQTGQDKAVFMAGFKKSETAAIGNGRNDVAMVCMAGLGVAVIGPEGCAGELIAAARIVCLNILAALDLLLNPLRIKATLRD